MSKGDDVERAGGEAEEEPAAEPSVSPDSLAIRALRPGAWGAAVIGCRILALYIVYQLVLSLAMQLSLFFAFAFNERDGFEAISTAALVPILVMGVMAWVFWSQA